MVDVISSLLLSVEYILMMLLLYGMMVVFSLHLCFVGCKICENLLSCVLLCVPAKDLVTFVA